MKRWRAMTWWATYPRQRIVGAITLAIVLATAITLLPVWRHGPARTSPSAMTAPVWIYGNTRARYTLIEYADLECPYCKAYFPELMSDLVYGSRKRKRREAVAIAGECCFPR